MISRRGFLKAAGSLLGMYGLSLLGGCAPHYGHSGELRQAGVSDGSEFGTVCEYGGEIWHVRDVLNERSFDGLETFAGRWDSAPLKKTYAAVIGAGAAGLSCVRGLEKLGLDDWMIIDGGFRAGGMTRHFTSNLQVCPWASARLSLPNPADAELLELLAEQGIYQGSDSSGKPQYDEMSLAFEPQDRLLSFGRWCFGCLDTSIIQRGSREYDLAARFDNFLMEQSRKKGADGLLYFTAPLRLASSEAAGLEHLTLAEYLRQNGFEAKFIYEYADRLTMPQTGLKAAQISARAGMYQLLRDGRRMLGGTPLFLTWNDGCARILRGKADFCGERLKLRTFVCGMRQSGKRTELLCLDKASGQLFRVSAEKIVVTGASSTALKMLGKVPSANIQPYCSVIFSTGFKPVGTNVNNENMSVLVPDRAWASRIAGEPGKVYICGECQSRRSTRPERMLTAAISAELFAPERIPKHSDELKNDRLIFDPGSASERREYYASSFPAYVSSAAGGNALINSGFKRLPGYISLLSLPELSGVCFALSDAVPVPDFADSFAMGLEAAQFCRK